MRTALAAICVLTLLAVAYLSLSLVVLRPPRANVPVWFALATFVGIQGVWTLWLIASRAANGMSVPRALVLAGGCALTAIGVWMVRDTLTSAHFEGYALVLGSMLVVQGLLTFGAFLRLRTVV